MMVLLQLFLCMRVVRMPHLMVFVIVLIIFVVLRVS